VAEQEGEVIVDAAVAIVQVGVAHTAGLDLDERLAGAGVGNVDGLQRDGLAFGAADDTAYGVGHGRTGPSGGVVVAADLSQVSRSAGGRPVMEGHLPWRIRRPRWMTLRNTRL
jgi:hypothetical protein